MVSNLLDFESTQNNDAVKKVAILQSNYIPWKGYFDLIAAVDEFVIYDDVQYTRSDWRNRNQIKTPHGLQWLTVPVKIKGRFKQAIWETEIDNTAGLWKKKHWKAVELYYHRSRFFDEVSSVFRPLYLERDYQTVSELNREFIVAICNYIGIKTKISDSREFCLIEGKSERLVSICKQAGANEYISGPSAKDYLDESLFSASGIKVSYFDYTGYPDYPQFWGDFSHNVTILDALFHCGKNIGEVMKFSKK